MSEARGAGSESLTLAEYQRAARRTMNPALDEAGVMMDATAGLAEEAGEVLGLVRKHLYQGRPLDTARVAEELGDALWCVAALATALGLELGGIAAANLAKIARRHPERGG